MRPKTRKTDEENCWFLPETIVRPTPALPLHVTECLQFYSYWSYLGSNDFLQQRAVAHVLQLWRSQVYFLVGQLGDVQHNCKDLLLPEKTLVDHTLESYYFGQLFSLHLEDSSPCLKKATTNGSRIMPFFAIQTLCGVQARPCAPWEWRLQVQGREEKPAALISVLNSSTS